MYTDQNGSDTVISGIKDFDITQIFDCGQCFRFEAEKNADGGGCVFGVAHGRYIKFIQPQPGTLIIKNCSVGEYEKTWKHFLSLDADYAEIKADVLAHFPSDPTMKAAVEYGGGIRILRQEPWETVCSFIISQNNNIPRIKKIISEMSAAYGKKAEYQNEDGEGRTCYAFPTPESLISAGTDGLYELKTGFRAKYIYDAASKVADGSLDLDLLYGEETPYALKSLMNIKGIGPKVASCALLFAFGKTDAFPIDVWIKRVIEKYYPDGLDTDNLGAYAGIAQQYLFYYERYITAGKK